MNNQVVLVTWIDCEFYSTDGWRKAEAIQEWITEPLTECYSAGFLIHRDDNVVVVSTSVGQDGQSADFVKIPAVCVRSVEVLAEEATDDAETQAA